MRIIGIDPGLRNTGWGIIEFRNNRLIHVDDGRISPPSISSVGERLLFIKNKLSLIVKKYDPNISAIEQIFVGPGTGSSLKLGMARGVSILVLAQAGLQIKELPPKTPYARPSVATAAASRKCAPTTSAPCRCAR